MTTTPTTARGAFVLVKANGYRRGSMGNPNPTLWQVHEALRYTDASVFIPHWRKGREERVSMDRVVGEYADRAAGERAAAAAVAAWDAATPAAAAAELPVQDMKAAQSAELAALRDAHRVALSPLESALNDALRARITAARDAANTKDV